MTQPLTPKQRLDRSDDMVPVEGTVDVEIPVSVLWETFCHADWWPRWNRCFYWVKNRDLIAGEQLVWAFQPIRPWFLYKMPASARIIEVVPGSRVTWEVVVLPGFYAHHTYHMESLGDGRSRFGSWEKATGWLFRLTKWFWIPHFVFVKNRSLEGARQLEEVYRTHRRIAPELLPRVRRWPFLLALLLLLATLTGGTWFFRTYIQLIETELAPGVVAISGGGGNSLLVTADGDALLVETKFPPVDRWLRSRLRRRGVLPTRIVNTHYHYDHSAGNSLYPAASVYAHSSVPALMRARNALWWDEDETGVPEQLVDGSAVVQVGGQEVRITHPGPAHTRGDLWVYVKRGDSEVIATGDLLVTGLYPFIDLGGGLDIPRMIATLRQLAAEYPNARFVPGHGPVTTVDGVNQMAGYLQELWDKVADARSRGLSEDEAVGSIDLESWGLSPSFSPKQGVCWASAKNNIRAVFRVQAGTADPLRVPCSLWR